MMHSMINLNYLVDGSQDMQSTTDLIEHIPFGEKVDETKKEYQSEKEGYYSQSQITLLEVGSIHNSAKQQKVYKIKQESSKQLRALSSLKNTKNFIEDQFYDNEKEDKECLESQETLEYLDIKRCTKLISQILGEQVSLQFQVLFNQFKRENIKEINCFEQLWEEYRQQNLHKDVFKAAYLIINITTFQNNNKLFGKIRNLCIDLSKSDSQKSRKFISFIKDISYEYQINQKYKQ